MNESDTQSDNTSDHIYSTPQERIGDFVFDDNVAQVFEDMISRSAPGYSTIVSHIGVMARHFVQPNTRIYDLGCSLGACSLVVNQMVEVDGCELIAVDNSDAMVSRCTENLKKAGHRFPVSVQQADILELEIKNASLVVLNFTLQFIDKDIREALLKKIYDGLVDGGALVLSEKLAFNHNSEQELMIKLHHDFKRANGYSDLEIAQKRAAIENVLIPETNGEHICRLEKVGFTHVYSWFRCLNFASFLAIK
ncbi:carboxy-S-adenosyl-L-methionine synthase CmoA [Litoribrevibacter euphylliae]|uniref:Carboxy-S-adenosyl-L-methionine synthase n=1 Tax=Litoribrevibacter euphylliae TaxID=1834034 RepID=A0ABV7HAV4_9GAMM